MIKSLFSSNFRPAILRLFLVFAVSGLAACASPAEVQNMTVSPNQLESRVASSQFSGALEISKINGGESTNPLWTSEVSNAAFKKALRDSLQNTGLMSAGSAAKYGVEATLSQLDQPLIGFDLTVNSMVNYRVFEKASRQTVFDESVTASHTATFSDAAFAIQRLRFANEGSIRENIRNFINRLLER